MKDEYILELLEIEKEFPGVKALDGVDLRLRKGSVHALVGENGAGKSTLMKILSGVYTLDKGNIILEGEHVRFSNTREAQRKGISIIHQELNLCWNLTVAENVLLCHEKVGRLNFYKKKENEERVRGILQRLGVSHVDPCEPVSNLGIANQQMVEIAKAISIDAKILIMDEPTSSLTEKEEEILFNLIRRLSAQDVSIIYISHKLEEIFEVCDEVTVIRDGKWIDTFPVAGAKKEHIVELMVGRSIDIMYPKRLQPVRDEVVFEVEGLSKAGLLSNISFQIKAGEILGVSGLVGAGRSEMAKAVFGTIQKDSGTIRMEGKPVAIHTPSDAIACGLAFITEDRKSEGLFLDLSVKDNLLSANLEMVRRPLSFVDVRKEVLIAKEGVEKLSIRTPDIQTSIKSLSGGNQQKVIIARWLAKSVKVLIMDEPTRGIDVGAKKAIYDIMRMLTASGIAILLISSELPEILGMSDRIAVMGGGRILDTLSAREATQHKIMTIITEG